MTALGLVATRDLIDWTTRQMPVLAAVAQQLAAGQVLAGRRIAACLHISPETACLVRALESCGAEVALAASNPLSTSDAVAAVLAADGTQVHARRGVDRAGYRAQLVAALGSSPQLVLDDGCDLVTTLHTSARQHLDGVRGGAEATTTGVLRLRRMAAEGALGFPMAAVNDTPVTRLVDNRFGTGQSVLDAVLRASGVLLAGRTVVVAGYGPCGRGIAERAAGLGGRVVVTEIDPLRAFAATLAGYQVLPMAEAVAVADVLVTATGSVGVVRAEHLGSLKDGAVLANAGHFDVEIDVPALHATADTRSPGVRAGTELVRLPGGRTVTLLAAGRVANLAVADGHPPEVMDIAFATHALVLAWLATDGATLPAGVHAVPPGVSDRVAAAGLAGRGVTIDAPTPDQVAYRASWQHDS